MSLSEAIKNKDIKNIRKILDKKVPFLINAYLHGGLKCVKLLLDGGVNQDDKDWRDTYYST